MKRLSKVTKALMIALIGFITMSTTGLGQSMWAETHDTSTLVVEFIRPSFGSAYEETGLKVLSSAMFATANVVASPAVTIVIELPVAYADVKRAHDTYYWEEDYLDNETGLSVGNPYLGVRVSEPGSGFRGEVGVRVPLAPGKSYPESVGLYADWDRYTAFLHKITTIRTSAIYRHRLPTGVFVQVTGGGFLGIPKEGDPEAFGQYGFFIGAESKVATVKAGVTGLMLITESELNFSERTTHQLGVTADLNLHAFRPGLQVRVPLDEATGNYRYAFGVGMSYALN